MLPTYRHHPASGELQACLLTPRFEAVLSAREAGWVIRDTILVFAPEGPLFGHLLRRPFDGAFLHNLDYVALNIDGCRNAWVDEADRLAALPGSMPHAHVSIVLHQGTQKFPTRDRSEQRPEDVQNPLGRWPANAVVLHHESCSSPSCAPQCPSRRLPRSLPRFENTRSLIAWLSRLSEQ